MKPTFSFVASPNFRPGRRKPISAIVIHYTDSLTLESPVDWFKDKASGVSAHYVIGRDGTVVQMVKDTDVAWHAGRSTLGGEPNVNEFSIGIELVGTQDSGFVDRQLASLYDLLARLVAQYKILPERVVGHSFVAPGRKRDPEGTNNQFPWAKAREVCRAALDAVSVVAPPTSTAPGRPVGP